MKNLVKIAIVGLFLIPSLGFAKTVRSLVESAPKGTKLTTLKSEAKVALKEMGITHKGLEAYANGVGEGNAVAAADMFDALKEADSNSTLSHKAKDAVATMLSAETTTAFETFNMQMANESVNTSAVAKGEPTPKDSDNAALAGAGLVAATTKLTAALVKATNQDEAAEKLTEIINVFKTYADMSMFDKENTQTNLNNQIKSLTGYTLKDLLDCE